MSVPHIDVRTDAPHTIGGLLEWQAAQRPSDVFLEFGEATLTYAEMNALANRTAYAIAERGVERGQTVAVMLDNGIEFLALWLALAKLGAIAVPLNTAYAAGQVQHVLGDSGTRLLVISGTHLDRLAEALSAVPSLEALLTFDASGSRNGRLALHDLRAAIAAAPDDAPNPGVQVLPSDPLAVLHTSGTTGLSKGVVLCHEHEHFLATRLGERLGVTPADCFYNCYPLYHNTGQGIITCTVLAAGARMFLRDRFSRSAFWSDVRERRCTIFYYLGTILDALLGDPGGVEAGAGHGLRVAVGIGTSQQQADDFRSRFGIELVTLWGSTETNLAVLSPREDPRLDTAGLPQPEFDVRIHDGEDLELPAGEIGEIVVRPLRPHIMFLGYHNHPEVTVEATRNLWFHTGDAGFLDGDGYLHFVDRIKDVIRHRGYNISSFEIEAAVLGLDGVQEAAAVGVASDRGPHEHDILVSIVLAPGADLPPEAVVDRCTRQLPRYAVPRYVAIVPELPKTQTEKVRKVALRDRGVPAGAWDRLTS